MPVRSRAGRGALRDPRYPTDDVPRIMTFGRGTSHTADRTMVATTAPSGRRHVVDPMQTLVIAITALVTTNVVAISLGRDRRRRRGRR
jgi:hypothetical protein